MIKDYLKFRNAVKKDKGLTLAEGCFLEVLYDYYNVDKGYAYPTYETLMSDIKSNRRSKVSDLIKALIKKGYIAVNKIGRKNTYTLLKYLFLKEKKNSTKEHQASAPEENDIEVKEEVKEEDKETVKETVTNNEISEEVKTIVDATNVTIKQAEELLSINNNIAEVIEAIDETDKRKGIKNRVAYAKTILKNGVSLITDKTNKTKSSKKGNSSFHNFKGRDYNYDKLEAMLLGWDEETDLSACTI